MDTTLLVEDPVSVRLEVGASEDVGVSPGTLGDATLTVQEDDLLPLSVADGDTATLEIGCSIIVNPGGDAPRYDGEYTVTPSEEAQTFQTASKLLARNIVVEPIPSNYGRILWNGATLTVY